MTKEQFPLDGNEPLDPQLASLLSALNPTSPRDPEAVKRGRARFLAELETSIQSASASLPKERGTRLHLPGRLDFLIRIFRKNQPDSDEDTNMSTRQAFVLTGFALVLVIAIFVFGSAGITVVAAQGTLPGDTLYPVKTGIEQTRLALAQDAGSRLQIMLGLAERRLTEIERLAAEGRYSDMEAPAQEFETQIFDALAELETIFAGDPDRASQLASQITGALSRYASTLSSVSATAPETVKPVLTQAQQTAEIASDLRQVGAETEFLGVVESIGPEVWTVSGIQIPVNSGTEIKGVIAVGDVVKIHLTTDGSGNRIAREIEPARLGGTPGDDDGFGDDRGGDDRDDDVFDDGRGGDDDNRGDDDEDDDTFNDDRSGDDRGEDAGHDDDGLDDSADDGSNDDRGGDDRDNDGSGDDRGDDDPDDGGNDDDDDDDDSDDNSDDNSGSGDDDDEGDDNSGNDDDDDDDD